ncbi:histone-lysine N-methyltransferase SETMAR [Trichonephila clavipes]|nr:histone-lysine N-methyltransferase SETMAR [Trichonephila clavipes]
MEALIPSPATCEVRTVIKFLNAQSIAPIEIHRQFVSDLPLKFLPHRLAYLRVPDLTPSDFHVFLHLKKVLSSGESFGNDEEQKTFVTRWFHSQAAEFYDRGIQKLIPRYDMCPNSGGGYVEK